MAITPVTIPTTSIFPIVLLMLQAQLVPYRFRFLLGLWTKLLVLSALSVSGVFAYDTITTVVLSWLLYLFQRKRLNISYPVIRILSLKPSLIIFSVPLNLVRGISERFLFWKNCMMSSLSDPYLIL